MGVVSTSSDAGLAAESGISLIIPVYNRPQLITECLASLAPALVHLREVIVVDDGSTDGKTPEAARAAIAALEAVTGTAGRVRFHIQPNAGPGAARNTAASMASGEWLFFLDSDDCWLPWTMPALIGALARHPDAVALFMNTLPFSEVEEIVTFAPEPEEVIRCDSFFDLARMRPGPIRVGAGYFAVRREIFLSFDGFVPGLRGSEDTDLFYRIAHEGVFLALKHPVTVARRISNVDSLTLNMAAVYEGMDFMLKGHQEGRFVTARPQEVERALGDMLGFWIHELFWRGYGREGYHILLRRGGFGILCRQGKVQEAMKLLFIPVLSVLRPKNHRFRWRPTAAPRTTD